MSDIKVADKLFDDRRGWESLWDITYRYIAPERAAIFPLSTSESPSNIGSDVFDSTAIEAAEKLVNLLISGLIPPWAKWFRLMPGASVTDQADRSKMMAPLQEVTDLVLQTLANSNFYQEMQPVLLDRVVGGTGGLAISTYENKLTFQCIPLSEMAISEDSLGRISHVARRCKLDLATLRRLYWEKVPPRAKEQYEGKPDTETVDAVKLTTLEADGQWKYRLVLKCEGNPELEVLYDRVPRMLPTRWSKIPGSAYGRGPGLRALSDVRALNKIKELTLKNAALAVSGAWTVVADGVLNPHTLVLEPGARIPVATNNPNDPSILPLPSFADFDVANFSMDDLRNSIQAVFMADQFQPLGRTPLSATEVVERTRVISTQMGASLARLQYEILVPVLRFVLDWLQRRGAVPDFVEINDGFSEVQFVSRLAQAQWAEDRNNLLELVSLGGNIGQFDPRAALVVDGEAVVRQYAELQGTPAWLLRTSDQVTENLEAAQQARQQQPGIVEEGLTG